MPLFAPDFEGRDPRPDGHALPGPLPDPDPARDQRRRRRHPQQLRPLRRLRDLAAVLEPDDHPRARRPRAAVPRPEPDLRLRDRDPVGTLVQLLIPTWDLRNTPFQFSFSFDWRHPGVRRVLLLMLPVTISLGLINFNALINSFFGSLVSEQAPAAIDKAFRIYQLPQGIFSVAIATVLFPTLARFANSGEIDNLRATMANGMRQILFVLVPAAAAILALSEPMIRLVYQRGEFDAAETTLVATALFWFAFSLPTNGLYLLQTRTFFSLQRPWQATGLAVIDLVVSALAALAPLQAVRGRRDRRRDRDRDQRRGRRPGGDPAPRVRRPRARPPVLDDGADHDRLGGAGRRRAGGLGPARPGARARPGRPDRLARGRPRRRRPRLPRGRPAAADRRARADPPPAAPPRARCSAPAATCWASPSCALLVGFAWLGAVARAAPAAAAARGRAGVAGERAIAAGAADLGGGAAGDGFALRAGALSARGGGRRRRDMGVRAEGRPPGRGRAGRAGGLGAGSAATGWRWRSPVRSRRSRSSTSPAG